MNVIFLDFEGVLYTYHYNSLEIYKRVAMLLFLIIEIDVFKIYNYVKEG